MGGKVVWFPTISSGRHIECHPEHGDFPTTTVPLTQDRIDIIDEHGRAVVSGGHMYPEYIRQLFEAAQATGITRMMINHPNFVIGAEPEMCQEYVRLGAFVEHEMIMYDPEGPMKWEVSALKDWIETIGPEHTVLSSDLGQVNNPKPVDSFLRVCSALLDLRLPEKDLQCMVRDNPTYLLDLDA